MIYYKFKNKIIHSGTDNLVIEIFNKSRNNYGTWKIKVELSKIGVEIPRKSIAKIMKRYSLVSNYTVKQFKVQKSKCNEDKISNIVRRKFNNRECLEVVVSDLSYVNVGGKWNYVCLLLDLFNRGIIGDSSGPNKDAKLVEKAFFSTGIQLSKIKIFHTDRDCEFKNTAIDSLLTKYIFKDL